MLHRQLRLHRREDYARMRQAGKTKHTALLSLSLMPNERSHNRYGFIVSKQVGGAVVRNRVRRQLSEAVRLLHPRLRTGYDLVWIARRPLVGKPYDEIARSVHELCRQTGMLISEGK